jgi:hypothetical protein
MSVITTTTVDANDRTDRYVAVTTPAGSFVRGPVLASWDGEQVRVVQGVNTNTWELDRGVGNTLAANHAAGSTISIEIAGLDAVAAPAAAKAEKATRSRA